MAQDNLAVEIIGFEAPKSLITGQSFSIKLRLNNKGGSTLSSKRDIGVLLRSNSNQWQPVKLDLGKQSIAAGQTMALTLSATAPSSADIYELSVEVVKGKKAISRRSEVKLVSVETRDNYVNFISQVVPENMQASNKYMLIVQYKNKGRHIWTNKDHYRLELFGKHARSWTIKNAELAKNSIVSPGQIATFRFELKAPKKAGKYLLQMRLKKGRKTSFGEPSPPIMINVTQGQQELDAEFLHQAIPGMQQSGEFFSIFKSGNVYPITLTFKNKGSQPWLPGIYRLVALHDKSDFFWSIGQVELKANEVVHPGQIKSFNFNVIAPLEPGIYNFQWQIRKGTKTWIGEASEQVIITVQ